MTDQDHPRFDADSPIAWCGSDRRASNGDPLRDTDPAPAMPRWPTLELIGLGEALDQLEAVAAANQHKHPARKWLTQTIAHEEAKCIKHLGAAQCGEVTDHDSGLPARAHATLRLMMALGLELLAAEPVEPTR